MSLLWANLKMIAKQKIVKFMIFIKLNDKHTHLQFKLFKFLLQKETLVRFISSDKRSNMAKTINL